MPRCEKTWSCSLRHSFQLYPKPDRVTEVFLDSDGRTESDIAKALPFSSARSQSDVSKNDGRPDGRRLREPLAIYEQIGLLERTNKQVTLTSLGKALSDWRDRLDNQDAWVVASHVASALAACQLRNPTQLGIKYDVSLKVFPMAFIWRAMLELDNKISSDELNREVFRLTAASEIPDMIARIRAHRNNPTSQLRGETVTGKSKNDRIIPWMAMASCGWLLIAPKKETRTGYYKVRHLALEILRLAVRREHVHMDFHDIPSYLERIQSSGLFARTQKTDRVFPETTQIISPPRNPSLKAPTADPADYIRKANKLLRRGPVKKPVGLKNPAPQKSLATVYYRDPQVRAWVLQRAAGRCELCNAHAPFHTDLKELYLESHHIDWLANGGPDTPENTAALCPNCHREVHSGINRKEKSDLLRKIIREKEV